MTKLSGKQFLFFLLFILGFFIFAFGFSKPALAACPAGKCPETECYGGWPGEPLDCYTVCVPCSSPPPGGGEEEEPQPGGCVEGKSCTSNSECPGGVCVYDPYNPACCCDCGGPCFTVGTKIASPDGEKEIHGQRRFKIG